MIPLGGRGSRRAAALIAFASLAGCSAGPDPREAAAELVTRANRLQKASEFRRETETLIEAAKLAPKDLNLLRRLLANPGQMPPKEIEKLARQALTIAPEDPELRYFLGAAIAEQGDPGRTMEAEQELRKSLDSAPDGIPSLIELGKLLASSGRHKEAIVPLAQAAANLDLAQERFAGGAPLTEIENWTTLRRNAAFWLAEAYRGAGHTKEARQAAEEAARRSREAATIRTLRDRAYARPPDPEARNRVEAIMRAGMVEDG
jgi:tetratricopeptide (TPR) repeat protein